jgi:predicted TIM-barrel enzyme
VSPDNAYDQLRIADGAIIGSSFKPEGDTWEMVERPLIELVKDEIRRARNEL